MIREEARIHINKIKESYEKGEHIIKALAGALWVVEKVFVRSGHFLFEFIQNADDAEANRMKAILNEQILEVFNDGNPFSKEDVNAICSIGHSFKDPSKYLGYLGAGFKAVFLISPEVAIYSYPYSFKFSKKECPDPRNLPWQIMPLWIEEYSQEYKERHVVFKVSLSDKEKEKRLQEEFQTFNPRSLLFLPHLKELILEVNGEKRVIRKKEMGENIWRLECISDEKQEITEWLILTSVIKVPEEIRKDSTTQDWGRSEVEERRIAFAFKLNEERDLVPEPRGTAHTGVFSFLPLREEGTDIPFLVQGDFLTGAGRDAISREAPWNIWLTKELFRFAKEEIISFFKNQGKWRFSYPQVMYAESAHPLFGKHLIFPLAEEINKGAHFIDVEGNFKRADEVVAVSENISNKLGKEMLEKFTGRNLLHPSCKIPSGIKDSKISRFRDWALYCGSEEAFKERLGKEWKEYQKRFLEGLAEEFYSYAPSTRSSSLYQDGFRTFTRIFDEEEKLGTPFPPYATVYLASESVIRLAKLLLPGRFCFIHPILRNELILQYLRDLGTKELSEKEIIEILEKEKYPQLLEELREPLTPSQRKIELIKLIKEGIEQGYALDIKGIPVKTKSGKWLKAQEVLFATEFKPEEDIEALFRKGLLDGEHEFLDPIFIERESPEGIQKWREFFKEAGIEEGIDKTKLVQRVAILTAKRYEEEVYGLKEGKDFYELSESEAQGKGYDIKSKMPDGSPKCIEVKGRRREEAVEVGKNQYQLAMKEKERTWIYIVINALKTPELFVVKGESLAEFLPTLRLTPSEWRGVAASYWKPDS
ncbi:DUF3883 domain-containing protein [Dehalococcoidia bacterium]|nr:DUF3883 domain-containing protein [Dehalococcoidia bacterium]MCL0064870.1 DUF3883 domain-containing protein [Dehalococcoidia bacterium]